MYFASVKSITGNGGGTFAKANAMRSKCDQLFIKEKRCLRLLGFDISNAKRILSGAGCIFASAKFLLVMLVCL